MMLFDGDAFILPVTSVFACIRSGLWGGRTTEVAHK
jgi:hypothetical protein